MSRASRLPTIAPAKIETIDDWIKGKAKKYANLVIRDADGALLVLNPETLDSTSPVKTIQRTKAIDAIDYLNNGRNKELRVQSQTRMDTLAKERHAKAAPANDQFREKERQLLAKHVEWKVAEQLSDKIRIATEIGILQKELSALDNESRQALFPKRFLQEKEFKRIILDDDTGQKRFAQKNVFVINTAQTDAHDRAIAVSGN